MNRQSKVGPGHPFSCFGRQLSARKGQPGEGERLRPPAETFAAYAPLMARAGITRIANISGLDSLGVHTYTAIRPLSRALTTAQGKGLDAMSAKTAALMESLESWHAEHIAVPLRFESYEALRREAVVVDAARLPLAARRRFARDTPMLWLGGCDLLRSEPVFVPYESVTMNTVHPSGYKPTFCVSSDGLASGNHILEAMVHGLSELIERDAAALWYASGAAPLPVDLESVEDDRCRTLMQLVRAGGSEVVAWDITSDVGLPVYACYVLEPRSSRSARGLGFYQGFGAHLDPSVALFRALVESVQSRVTFISGSRDDLFYEDYRKLRDPALLNGIWDEIEESSSAAIPFGTHPSRATDTFEDDLRVLMSMLAPLGLDSVVAVDLTKEDIGLPVVKILVPGLEPLPSPEVQSGERVKQLQAREAARGPA